MRTYWVYILASKPRGTLYIGVTNNLLDRVEAHRTGCGSKFTARYRVGLLVHYEVFGSINDAIQREKSMKRYLRDWKINLIERENRTGRTFTLRCAPVPATPSTAFDLARISLRSLFELDRPHTVMVGLACPRRRPRGPTIQRAARTTRAV